MLIAVEGIDGVGKTTQSEALAADLGALLTKWNSAKFQHKATKKLKAARALGPYGYAFVHAADMAIRYENDVLPALQDGHPVVADRYLYTAMVRDEARGLSRTWIETMYEFLPVPDAAILLLGDPRVSLAREGKVPKYYEAGQDVFPGDPEQAYLAYLGYIQDALQNMDVWTLILDTRDMGIDDVTQVISNHVAGITARQRVNLEDAPVSDSRPSSAHVPTTDWKKKRRVA